MILTGKSLISIEVDTDRFTTESLRRSDGAFAYLLDRLFSGKEVAVSEFESWGLVVTKDDGE